MIVTYLRSSSIGTFNLCEHQYFLDYILKIPQQPKVRTTIGSIVHKALELLALRKLAEQQNLRHFDGEDLGKIDIKECEIPYVVQRAFELYRGLEQPNFGEKEHQECLDVLTQGLNFRNGLYNPLNQNVISVEKFFDFEIDRPWSSYDYTLPDGTKAVGKLSVKGTLDLIVSNKPGTVELLDWKTGARKNWGTGQAKDFKYLINDDQLMLYYYAMSHLFPNDHVDVTIYYLRDDYACTVPFTPDDLPRIERMIRDNFEKIRQCEKPRLKTNYDWVFCNKICHYGITQQDDEKTICKHFADRIKSEGAKSIVNEMNSFAHILDYQSGGGRQAKSSQPET